MSVAEVGCRNDTHASLNRGVGPFSVGPILAAGLGVAGCTETAKEGSEKMGTRACQELRVQRLWQAASPFAQGLAGSKSAEVAACPAHTRPQVQSLAPQNRASQLLRCVSLAGHVLSRLLSLFHPLLPTTESPSGTNTPSFRGWHPSEGGYAAPPGAPWCTPAHLHVAGRENGAPPSLTWPCCMAGPVLVPPWCSCPPPWATPLLSRSQTHPSCRRDLDACS